MSFPSVAAIAAQMNVDLAQLVPGNEADEVLGERILATAIQRDLPLAWNYLHGVAHRADQEGKTIRFAEDPNSPLGKQIIRLAASNAAKEVVTKHCLHGRPWVFINCCGGLVPKDGDPMPKISMVDQIHHQDGTHARADC